MYEYAKPRMIIVAVRQLVFGDIWGLVLSMLWWSREIKTVLFLTKLPCSPGTWRSLNWLDGGVVEKGSVDGDYRDCFFEQVERDETGTLKMAQARKALLVRNVGVVAWLSGLVKNEQETYKGNLIVENSACFVLKIELLLAVLPNFKMK